MNDPDRQARHASFSERCDEMVRIARNLHETPGTTLEKALRALVSATGAIVRLFPDKNERKQYLKSAQREEVCMILRAIGGCKNPARAYTVITVRLPRETHHMLRDASTRFGVSMNALCVAKLSLPIPAHLIDPSAAIEIAAR